MIKKDVIVVGAGLAGMAASIEAAKRGCQVTMIDSNRVAGGQLYKQIHKFFGSSAHKAGTRGIDIGADMVQQAKDLGVEVILNSSVIGLFEPMTVAVEIGTDPDHPYVETFSANQIVIASGASENVVRFDGWTKPGEMYDLAVVKNDFEAARAINDKCAPFYDMMEAEPYPGPVKAGLECLGIPAGPVRKPLTQPSAETKATMAELLKGLGYDVK